MNQLKKIERRLTKLRRLQKQLEKKKRKIGRLVAKNKKRQSRVRRLLKAQKVTPVVPKGFDKKKALFGFVFGTICAVSATLAVRAIKARYLASADGPDEYIEGVYDGMEIEDSRAQYDKASLEELEDALLRVENELDEVSAAIENAKK